MSPKTPIDASAESLLEALVRSAYQVTGVLTRIGAEHDLSLTQLRVLGILRDRRVRMSELAEALGLDKSTMTGLIDRAEERGLLERLKDSRDKRVTNVSLTPAGRQLAQRLYAEFVRDLAPMVGRLPHERRIQFTQLFESLLPPGGRAPSRSSN